MKGDRNGSHDDGPAAAPAQPLRFFCDSMLGRLAKWLRLLGYDTAYEREIGDWDLVRQASRQYRVLLTRDRDILKRWQVRRGWLEAYLVEAGRIESQLDEVMRRFALYTLPQPRCPEDNHELARLAPEDARGRVPRYVSETQQEFRTCPKCGRVYWKATHWENIQKRLRS